MPPTPIPSTTTRTGNAGSGRSDFSYGQFGENFTVEGLTEDRVHVGDLFRIGEAVVEVSQPRTPCFKLAMKMRMPEFPKLFLQSCRTGFFMRVLEEGAVRAGAGFELVRHGPGQITVREVCRLYHFDRNDLEGARRAARLEALPVAWRRGFAGRVARAERGEGRPGDARPDDGCGAARAAG